MAKYHVNPKTGEIGECHAEQGKCPFGNVSSHFTSEEKAQKVTDKINQSIVGINKKLDKVFNTGEKGWYTLPFDYKELASNATRETAIKMLNEAGFKLGEKWETYYSVGIGVYMSENRDDCKRAFIEALWDDYGDREIMDAYFPKTFEGIDEDIEDGWEMKWDYSRDVAYERTFKLSDEEREEELNDTYSYFVDQYVNGGKTDGENESLDKEFEDNIEEGYIKINEFERDGKTIYAIVSI